jgi:hypothetical protein
MPINLKEAMKKKLPPKEGGGEIFKFETIGDQVVGKFLARRTVTTTRGEPADLIDIEILGAEKIDKKTGKPAAINPGAMVVFLSTHLKRLFDSEPPAPGDVIRVQFSEVGKRDLKLFGFEILERANGA